MGKIIDYNVWINIYGEIYVDDYSGDRWELLDHIFPDGWDGSIYEITTDTHFMPNGYIDVTDEEDEEDEEDE